MQPALKPFAVLFFLAASRGALAQPGLSGESGTLPDPPPPISREGHVVGSGRPSDLNPEKGKLRCGVEYYFTTEAVAPVETCAGFDYAALYDRAVALGAYDLNLRCDAGCGPLKRFQIGREWECSQDSGAWVKILWGVVCEEPGHAVPRDLVAPSPGSLKEPFRYHRDGPWIYVSYGDIAISEREEIPLDCPSRRFLSFTYDESAPDGCNAPGYDEGPALARANVAAQAWFELLRCPGKCVKSGWNQAFVYKKWDCKARTFHVDYTLKVSCEK